MVSGYTYQLYQLLSVQSDYMKVEEGVSNMRRMIISHVLQPALSPHNYFPSYLQLALAYYTDWKNWIQLLYVAQMPDSAKKKTKKNVQQIYM